jgi:MFS family permease
MQSTWAWRLPSILQALFSILAIAILPFIPESPRWLEYQGRHAEAHMVVARLHSSGDLDDPVTLAQIKEIEDTINFEKQNGETLSFLQMVKTPNARKRLTLALSAGVFSDVAGMFACRLQQYLNLTRTL